MVCIKLKGLLEDQKFLTGLHYNIICPEIFVL